MGRQGTPLRLDGQPRRSDGLQGSFRPVRGQARSRRRNSVPCTGGSSAEHGRTAGAAASRSPLAAAAARQWPLAPVAPRPGGPRERAGPPARPGGRTLPEILRRLATALADPPAPAGPLSLPRLKDQKGISSSPSPISSGTRGEVFHTGGALSAAAGAGRGAREGAGLREGEGAGLREGPAPLAGGGGGGGGGSRSPGPPAVPEPGARGWSRASVNSAFFSFTPSWRVTVLMRILPSRTSRWPGWIRFWRSWARFPQPTTFICPGGSSGRRPSKRTTISATGVWLSWV